MLNKTQIFGLLAASIVIPSAAFAGDVVIKTIPVETTTNTNVRTPGCVNTTYRHGLANKPVSRTVSISKQTRSINGMSSSTEVYQSSVSSNTGGVNDVLCVLPGQMLPLSR